MSEHLAAALVPDDQAGLGEGIQHRGKIARIIGQAIQLERARLPAEAAFPIGRRPQPRIGQPQRQSGCGFRIEQAGMPEEFRLDGADAGHQRPPWRGFASILVG